MSLPPWSASSFYSTIIPAKDERKHHHTCQGLNGMSIEVQKADQAKGKGEMILIWEKRICTWSTNLCHALLLPQRRAVTRHRGSLRNLPIT
jgi:hypothetical protein